VVDWVSRKWNKIEIYGWKNDTIVQKKKQLMWMMDEKYQTQFERQSSPTISPLTLFPHYLFYKKLNSFITDDWRETKSKKQKCQRVIWNFNEIRSFRLWVANECFVWKALMWLNISERNNCFYQQQQ
jgi:hypothetical protein